MSVSSGWSFTKGGDERGWILAAVSGIACMLGSCIICIDILTRYIPQLRHFSIRKNKTFLAAALSLSFGVMIFSALYGILPEASVYMIKGGKKPSTAKFMSIGFFLVGVLGLSIISELLHRSLPSSIVHCEHGGGGEEHKGGVSILAEEEEESTDEDDPRNFHRHQQHSHSHSHNQSNHGPHHHHHSSLREQPRERPRLTASTTEPHIASESTPLLDHGDRQSLTRRPSLKVRLSESVSTLITGKKSCTGDGTCYGFSENRPCGRMCGAHIPPRATSIRNGMHGRGVSLIEGPPPESPFNDGTVDGWRNNINNNNDRDIEAVDPLHPYPNTNSATASLHRTRSAISIQSHHTHTGHHHVPTNEFLSIGVQTSLAIALHKLPEGFITFATNHANPRLGFAVFLALAIHNISEGFAMSLPLFLATSSRKKAILWASCLGGLSQPAGALFAWVWLWTHSKGEEQQPSPVVYGILFAVTAGIMSNVAVQLYGQAVAIYHNQKVPLLFAFIGMGILGTSFAVAE